MNNDLQERLSLLHYQPDEKWQHVTILDQTICRDCKNKQCLTFCPSGVFRENSQKKQSLLILYKQCVECGGCRLICDNIDFSYPKGGYGVTFLEG
ncbi:ferredoxin family protein [Pelosinus fermentans]|uniref:4Fe-4S ferredoxin-type domain-containing protein n=1 Tax=Pelosinus fermentans JBW45 TaxID=1192197 RepID=I8TTY7_9FIRM|nr:4Fe-4S dicluster domain-containing protein [Pelosinus fermentans]AJQ28366.1 hypothetical protein JBW_03023 [Pelosinus fermentans JBW45]